MYMYCFPKDVKEKFGIKSGFQESNELRSYGGWHYFLARLRPVRKYR